MVVVKVNSNDIRLSASSSSSTGGSSKSSSTNSRRISDTTDGRLLFLSGLRASLLFFLPDSSSLHSSDRQRGYRVVLHSVIVLYCFTCRLFSFNHHKNVFYFAVFSRHCFVQCVACTVIPEVISMLCLSSSSLLIFSSSSLCTVSNSSSFSLCRHTHNHRYIR